jgi:hypothetical protein
MEYNYHQDPGHGWIEVPIEELTRLKITPSAYSFRKGETAYLEEDCDAGAWARAKRLAGEAFTLVDIHTTHDHPIRTYQPFGA